MLASDRLGKILISLYLVSGAISLVYEILWTRMLSLQFGVSVFGVVVTVTAFMAGLGAGSFLCSRWSQRAKYPLRIFAILELSVAASALIIPALFRHLDAQLASLASSAGLTQWFAVQLVTAILVLMMPAIAMGAGFPMILAAVRDSKTTLGDIYGLNAVGGAIGALFPLWLLPTLGWLSSMRVTAMMGMAVGLIAFALSWKSQTTSDISHLSIKRPPGKWLITYAGIGAGALMLEIGWTRLFGMVLLRTEYVLAIILAVFLIGIGLGSLLARYCQSRLWFTFLPVFASSFAIVSVWLLPELSAWAETAQFDSLFSSLLQQGMAITSLTLPVTLVLGAWLPLFTARLDNRYQSGVWLYGANSIGAAIGSLLAGFVLIPAIGTASTIVLGAIILLTLGLTWSEHRRAWIIVPLLCASAFPALKMSSVQELLPMAYGNAHNFSLHEDAVSITHVVEKPDGQRQLLADLRRMDASSDPTAVVVQMNQSRLPLLLHPAPKSVLFLGLGTGISAAGSLAFPGLKRTAVELSQGAINAAENAFVPVNGGITDKMNIVRDDARHYLMSSSKSYDVIIGDLFHPDLVGRSALLSRQQFQRAYNHMTPGGVFVQWLALNQFDVDSLKVVLHTFKGVFSEAVIFVDAFRLAMVGMRDGVVSSDNMLDNLRRMSVLDSSNATGGEGPWTWLGRYWGRIPDFNVPVQDEWAPVIEYGLPMRRYSGELDMPKILEWLISIRPPILQASVDLRIRKENISRFENTYTATGLAHRSWLAMLMSRANESLRLLPLAYQANKQDRWIGFALADGVLANRASATARGLSERDLYETVLRIRPDHTEALRGLWHLAESAGDMSAAKRYRDRLAALSPLDSEIRHRQN